MSANRTYPLTPDALRAIADQVEEITKEIGHEESTWDDSDWRYNAQVAIVDEFGSTIGHVKAHGDGWLGFYPKEVTE